MNAMHATQTAPTSTPIATYGSGSEGYLLTSEALVRESAHEKRRWAIALADIQTVKLECGHNGLFSFKLTQPDSTVRTVTTHDFGAPTPAQLSAYRALLFALHRELARRPAPVFFQRGSNFGWNVAKVCGVVVPMLVAAAVLFLLVRGPTPITISTLAALLSGWSTSARLGRVSLTNGKAATYVPSEPPAELLPA